MDVDSEEACEEAGEEVLLVGHFGVGDSEIGGIIILLLLNWLWRRAREVSERIGLTRDMYYL